MPHVEQDTERDRDRERDGDRMLSNPVTASHDAEVPNLQMDLGVAVSAEDVVASAEPSNPDGIGNDIDVQGKRQRQHQDKHNEHGKSEKRPPKQGRQESGSDSGCSGTMADYPPNLEAKLGGGGGQTETSLLARTTR